MENPISHPFILSHLRSFQLTWWIVNRIANLKRYILAIQTRNVPDDLTGSASLVDRLIDAFLYGTGAFILIATLESEMGMATRGFAALGGLSTIVISLASQGLISQVFYGLFLATSQKFRKGDVVKFGDGHVGGLVASLGWMDTLIRGKDGVLMSVPNKDLGKLRSFYWNVRMDDGEGPALTLPAEQLHNQSAISPGYK